MEDLDLRLINISDIEYLPTTNPNSMSASQIDALEQSIRKNGFLQPIIVVEKEGKFILADGFHRMKVMSERIGHEKIPALVSKSDEQAARFMRISFNKIRGTMDYSLISSELNDMLENCSDLRLEDLEFTGLSDAELSALFDLDGESEEDLVKDINIDYGDDFEKPKSFKLVFVFDSQVTRAKVAERLRDYGETVEEALMSLVGVDYE